MTADLARLEAAQAKADGIASTVGEMPDGGPYLLVSVTDPETNTRLATCFVAYQPETRLRVVEP